MREVFEQHSLGSRVRNAAALGLGGLWVCSCTEPGQKKPSGGRRKSPIHADEFCLEILLLFSPVPPHPPPPDAALEHGWTLNECPTGQGWDSPSLQRGWDTLVVTCTPPGSPEERRGSTGLCWGGGLVPPHPQERMGARCHSLQGSGFVEGQTSRELSPSTGGVAANLAPKPQQNAPEKHSQPRLFSLPHTLQHRSFPPQRGERYTSMILLHFSR